MNGIKRTRLFLVMAGIVTVSQGCMAYRTRIPEPSKTYRERQGGYLRARLTLNAEHWANGHAVQSAHRTCLDRHKKAALKAFSKCGLFREVGPAVSNPDIEIVVDSKEEERYIEALPAVCGLTLMIFPAWVDVATETRAKVTTVDGKPIESTSAQSEARVIIELLLLPLTPTVFVTSARSTRDVYRSMAVEMAASPRIKELIQAKQKQAK